MTGVKVKQRASRHTQVGVVRRVVDHERSIAEVGASLIWLALMLVITPVVIWWWTQGVWGDFSALRPL